MAQYARDTSREAESAVFREEIMPLLYKDFSIADFFNAAFGIYLPTLLEVDIQRIEAIISDSEFENLLQEYLRISNQGKEPPMYKPFADLFNHVLLKWGCTRLRYIPLGSDPLKGSEAERKPDGALVPWPSENTPTDGEFIPTWGEVVISVEIKPRDKERKTLKPKGEPGNSSNIPLPVDVNGPPQLLHKQRTHRHSKKSRAPANAPPDESSPRNAPQYLITPPPALRSSLREDIEMAIAGSSRNASPPNKRKADAASISNTEARTSKLMRRDPNNKDGKLVKLSPQAQLASYGVEQLSTGPQRRFTFGCYVKATDLEIWYFDRGGGMGTKSFDLVACPGLFVLFIVALAEANSQQLGYEPLIRSPTLYQTSCVHTHLTIGGNVFYIREIIRSTRSLTGNGTHVLLVDWIMSEEGPPPTDCWGVVLKLSWQAPGRDPEWKLLNSAFGKGVHGIPIVLMKRDVGNLSDGMRDALPGSMPEIASSGKAKFENRILRLMVMTPKCKPLWAVTDLGNFICAFRSLVTSECIDITLVCKRLILTCQLSVVHHDLYERGGILHRDINPYNLMVEQDDDSQGVLIDLDLAVRTDDNRIGFRSNTRTQCTAFLAMDLLTQSPPLHQYRHDLESFFYVLVWIACHWDSGVQIETGGLTAWHTGTYLAMRQAKRGFLKNFTPFLPHFAPFQPQVEIMGEWFDDMCPIWKESDQGILIVDGLTRDQEMYKKFMSLLPAIE